MATNTAGSSGYHKSDANMRIVRGRRVTYSDFNGTDTITVCELPPRAFILAGNTFVITAFNDSTGDDLEVGFSTDTDALDETVDLNTGNTLIAMGELADADRFSTSARTVTCNIETAATGDGTAGEAYVYVEYVVIPSTSVTGA